MCVFDTTRVAAQHTAAQCQRPAKARVHSAPPTETAAYTRRELGKLRLLWKESCWQSKANFGPELVAVKRNVEVAGRNVKSALYLKMSFTSPRTTHEPRSETPRLAKKPLLPRLSPNTKRVT